MKFGDTGVKRIIGARNRLRFFDRIVATTVYSPRDLIISRSASICAFKFVRAGTGNFHRRRAAKIFSREIHRRGRVGSLRTRGLPRRKFPGKLHTGRPTPVRVTRIKRAASTQSFASNRFPVPLAELFVDFQRGSLPNEAANFSGIRSILAPVPAYTKRYIVRSFGHSVRLRASAACRFRQFSIFKARALDTSFLFLSDYRLGFTSSRSILYELVVFVSV